MYETLSYCKINQLTVSGNEYRLRSVNYSVLLCIVLDVINLRGGWSGNLPL